MPLVPRTLLFVPGDRPDRFVKAAGAGADAVILDLEDSVSPDRKQEALENVLHCLEAHLGWVRTNGLDTAGSKQEITALASAPGLLGLVVPKASDPSALSRVAAAIGGREVIALIETAAGVLSAAAIASAPGVTRMALGHLDLLVDLGISGSAVPDQALLYTRSQLVLASAAHRLPGPIDGIFPSTTDDVGLAASVRHGRELGFAGKFCIHPAQVAVVHHELAPSVADVAWAERVLASVATSGAGASAIDGEMIDAPQVERARRLVDLARREEER